jgi:hypothetical protein
LAAKAENKPIFILKRLRRICRKGKKIPGWLPWRFIGGYLSLFE